MAIQVASLFGVLSLDSSNFDTGLKNAGASLQQMGGQLQSFGAKATLATAPLAAGVLAAANAAVNFEHQFADVVKTVDATDEQLAALNDTIRTMATDSSNPLSSLENAHETLAGIMSMGGQLGVATENLEDFTQHIGALDVASNLTAEQAATQLAQFANVVQMSSDNYGNFASSLVRMGNNLASTEADMMNMTSRIAAAGSMAGLSETQILGFAGAISSLGINAELGGSNFGKFLMTMQTGIAEAGDALDIFAEVTKMGTAEFTAAWNEDPVIAIEEFLYALGKLDGASQLAVLKDLKLNGMEVQRVVLSLAGNTELLADALDLAAAGWEDGTDHLEEAAAKAETTRGSINRLKNQFGDMAIELGNVLLPLIVNLADMVSPVIMGFTKWAGENPALTTTLMVLAAVIGGIGPVALALGTAITALGAALSFVLSPIGLVIGGLALLKLAFDTNFLGIRNVIQPVIDRVRFAVTTVSKTLNLFTEDIKNFGIADAILGAFGIGPAAEQRGFQSLIANALSFGFGMAREDALAFVKSFDVAQLTNFAKGIQHTSFMVSDFFKNLEGYGVKNSLLALFGEGDYGFGESWVEGVLVSFGMARDKAEELSSAGGAALNSFFARFDMIRAGVKWFLSDVENFGVKDAILGAFGLGDAAEQRGGAWIATMFKFAFGVASEDAERFVSVTGGLLERFLGIAENVGTGLQRTGWMVQDFIKNFSDRGLKDSLLAMFGLGDHGFGESWIEGILVGFGMAREDAIKLSDAGGAALERFLGVAEKVGTGLQRTGWMIQDFFKNFSNRGLKDSLLAMFGLGSDGWGESWIEGILVGFGMAREDAIKLSDAGGAALERFIGIIEEGFIPIVKKAGAFLSEHLTLSSIPMVIGAVKTLGGVLFGLTNPVGWIIGAVSLLFTAFQTNFLGIRDAVEPVLQGISDFIQGTVLPAIDNLIAGVVKVWDDISPTLDRLSEWFVTGALPTIVNFIESVFSPVIDFMVSNISAIWDMVSPHLTKLYEWFISTGLPLIMTYIEGPFTGAINGIINVIGGIWGMVEPWLVLLRDGLLGIFDFIIANGIEVLTTQWETFTGLLIGAWDLVAPHLENLTNWFTNEGIPGAEKSVQDLRDGWENLKNDLSNLWEAVQPHLNNIVNWFKDSFATIKEKYIDPVVSAVQGFIDKINDALALLPGLGGESEALQGAQQAYQSSGVSYDQLRNTTSDAIHNRLGELGLGALGGPIDYLAGDWIAGSIAGRASGGPVTGGTPYLVGEEGPELFMPSTSGQIIDADRTASALGGLQIGNITIYANSEAEGRAAARGFQAQLDELLMARG